ncbi:MAG: hypothetical protein ABJB86_22135 [Bacteroidota bacterium]
MAKVSQENKPVYYTITELPLTESGKEKLIKNTAGYYKVNFLLIPLLILIFFWGWLYFSIFLAVTIIWNIVALKNQASAEKSMNKPATIITGKVTNKIKDEEVHIFFGPEEFDITYANPSFEIEVGDTISLYYSQKENGERGILLNVSR